MNKTYPFLLQLKEQFGYYVDIALKMIGSLGLVGAIILPFIEAFLPFLPLNVIILANVGNYGLFFGFLLSYIGSSLGSIAVFLIIRYLIRHWFQNLSIIKNNNQFNKIFYWIETKGMWVLMLLMCLPFFPHSLINYACALSKMRKRKFYAAMLTSKAIGIGFQAYIGNSLYNVFKNPIPLAIGGIIFIIMIIISKRIQEKFEKEDIDEFRNTTDN